jgi:hypothetical protein
MVLTRLGDGTEPDSPGEGFWPTWAAVEQPTSLVHTPTPSRTATPGQAAEAPVPDPTATTPASGGSDGKDDRLRVTGVRPWRAGSTVDRNPAAAHLADTLHAPRETVEMAWRSSEAQDKVRLG